MKKREFNKLCKIHFSTKEIELTNKQKHDMLLFIVKHRGAVHKSLITPLLDTSWIHSMGYLYGDETFIHNGETLVKSKTI